MRRKAEELEIQAAAYLYSQPEYQQADIGKILNLSPAVVSRAIDHAKNQGWLESKPRFVSTRFPPQRIEEIKARIAPQSLRGPLEKLREKHGGIIPEVRIFPIRHADSLDKIKKRQEEFGRMAAGYVKDLLLTTKGHIGICWGNTLAELIKGSE